MHQFVTSDYDTVDYWLHSDAIRSLLYSSTFVHDIELIVTLLTVH